MAPTHSDSKLKGSAAAADGAGTLPDPSAAATMPDWMASAMEQGIKPEQALAVIGLGLMNGLADGAGDRAWFWSDDAVEAGGPDLAGLRQRLELVQLALQTGAPLTTAEVTHLLGARPGAAVVQRGGLTARRLGRNVWKLSRSSEQAESSDTAFRDGFRRRL